METHPPEQVGCTLCGTIARIWLIKNGHRVYTCPACRLAFVHPLPGTLEGLYGEDYFAGAEEGFGYVDYDADKEPMVGAFLKYLAIIRQYRLTATSLFDVGAATGFFLDVARKNGFAVAGVELSEYAAAAARQKGIAVATGTLSEAEGSYDVITMLDLIEHVPDPRAELKNAHSLLASGGLLVINTPDRGSPYAKLMGKGWHLIVPPEHLYYFNRRNLAQLLAECGYRVVLTTTIGKNFTLPYILRTLHGWLGWGIFGTLADWSGNTFLRHVTLPINLGDNMFVIAEAV